MSASDKLPNWFEEIDHTGDVGIRVTAPNREALFARTAWGLFAVLTDMNRVHGRQGRSFQIEAGDRADLLRRWLSELNYVHVTEHWLFCRFEIETCTDERLEGTAYGEPVDPARHPIYTEVKAVTFHGLEVEEDDGSWRAQVIFDM